MAEATIKQKPMSKNLVIVESPAKAKTIEKFLGKDYKVLSSYGHIRDLKKKEFSIDVEKDFEPDYEIPEDKKALVKTLKSEAKEADTIWLASDEDREGEAIAWHLYEVLKLEPEHTKRIVFHEITKTAILKAIEQPRDIDLNLVNAQQARRILDRIVGFELSPVLWKKVKPALSAGRVQSVAVRLIVEREREIHAFQSEASYRVSAVFLVPDTDGKPVEMKAELAHRLKTKAEARKLLESCQSATFAIEDITTRPIKKSPAAPFTTSTLQQEAARKLGFTVAQTMMVAQRLYESGKITYMRTDSVNLSEYAINGSKEAITNMMGSKYMHPRHFSTKTKGAQEAHEAIRPTYMENAQIEGTAQEKKLYDLIWKRTIASQMADAELEKTTVTISISNAAETFNASGEVVKFDGFLRVYRESYDDDMEQEDESNLLPPLKKGQALQYLNITATERFTQHPPRYTEASLVRKLEELGIGRPSTYAPTISTITDRQYVVKEGKYLRPTPLGEVVTGLMKEKFPDIVDADFTAQMESRLDKVEAGEVAWKQVLGEFYSGFDAELKKAESELDGERIKVPDEESDEVCDLCGRKMVVKMGRFGRFLACPGWPECTFTKPLVVEMPGRCPKCGGRLVKRTGVSKKTNKQYTYYCCEYLNSKVEEKRCDFMTWDVPVQDDCPVCGHTLFKKAGRGARKPFCINAACPNFLPEDKRGYPRFAAKKTEGEAEPAPAGEEAANAAPAKETAAKGTETAAKKTAPAKKTGSKGTKAAPAKKTASKGTKAAAKKTTAAKKTAARKTAEKAEAEG